MPDNQSNYSLNAELDTGRGGRAAPAIWDWRNGMKIF